MSKYLEQYDLPCFPDAEPRPHARTVCGIEDTSRRPMDDTLRHDERGPFQLWAGGSGVGRAATIQEARVTLHARVADNLERHIAEAEERATYYRAVRKRWGTDERHMMRFEVEVNT